MKKLYVIAFFLLSTVMVNAQFQVPDLNGHNPDVPSLFPRNHQNRMIVNAWYNSGATMYNLGGSVSYFRNFLFPDSTVQVEFSTGYGYVWKHSFGHCFDPTSFMFDSNGEVTVGPGMPYTVDSISIPYRYWRYQTGAPDTLIIQLYNDAAITKVPNPGWTSGASYATVDYDYQNRIGDNATQTITYLLTGSDEINASTGYLYFPVGMNMAGGEKIAMTITYLPGNPYNVNDTIDTYASTLPVNQINAFVVYNYRDNDLMYEPLYYNNELAATTDVRYNISTTGWNGNYIPGTAWFSGIYHYDVYWKLTFDTDITGQTEHEDFSGLEIYPNPSNAIINFNAAGTITNVIVTDASGKIVMNESASSIRAIDVSGLSDGIYFMQLTSANGANAIQKFTKN